MTSPAAVNARRVGTATATEKAANATDSRIGPNG